MFGIRLEVSPLPDVANGTGRLLTVGSAHMLSPHAHQSGTNPHCQQLRTLAPVPPKSYRNGQGRHG